MSSDPFFTEKVRDVIRVVFKVLLTRLWCCAQSEKTQTAGLVA